MTNSEAIYKCLENSVSETAAPIKLFSVDDSKGFCIEIFLNITYSSTASFADLMFINNATDASFKFGYCPYAKIENGYSIEIWKTTSSNITTYYAALTASSALTTALSATWNIRKELKYGNYTELYSSAESVTIPASTDDNAYTTLSGANKNFIMDSDLNVTNVKATGNISANDFNATEKLTVGTYTSKTTIDSTGISTNKITNIGTLENTGSLTVGTDTAKTTIDSTGTITANKFIGNGEGITKISFKNLPNMYCGNLKVSTTSDSETSPEFSKITVGEIASDTIAGVTKNVLYGNIGNASDIIDDSNDYYRLRIGGESDAGYVSLETVDCITTTTNYLAIKTQIYNNLKPISVAQYYYVNDTTGSTTTSVPETEYKRAYLLDKKGNTSFPGTVTAPIFKGAATDLASNPSLLTKGDTIAVTAGNKTSGYITVPYATTAGETTTGEITIDTTNNSTFAMFAYNNPTASWTYKAEILEHGEPAAEYYPAFVFPSKVLGTYGVSLLYMDADGTYKTIVDGKTLIYKL